MGVLRWADAVDIGHGRGRLAGDAAASLRRVDDAFGRPADINEAWRSPEDADANYAAYLRFLAGGPWAPIALPGDQSVHCMGYALDTDDTADWQIAIWNDHGWYWTVYRNGRLAERWHLEYFRNRDNHRDEGSPAATDKPKEWDEMASPEDIKKLLVEVLTSDDRVTNKIALAVKNELDKRKFFADLSLIPIAELNNDMALHAASTQRRIRVQNTNHLEFIRRAAENRGDDTMSSAEVDIFDAYCLAVYPPEALKVDVEALSLALSRIGKGQPGVKAAVAAAVDAHTMAATPSQAPAS